MVCVLVFLVCVVLPMAGLAFTMEADTEWQRPAWATIGKGVQE
jgi:hypothetical protein